MSTSAESTEVAAAVAMTNNKLYIGNLSPTVNEESLRDLLKDKSGSLPASVLVKRGGYAFVECTDPSAAEKAIESLNGKFRDSSFHKVTGGDARRLCKIGAAARRVGKKNINTRSYSFNLNTLLM